MDEYAQQYELNRALNQQQLDGNAALNAPALHERLQESQAVLVAATNPSRVVWELELALRNLEEKEDGSLTRTGPPIMNDKGITRFKALMRGIITQGTALSHLDEKIIGKFSQKIADDITDDLALNWREYDIKDKMMLDHIVNIISMASHFCLMRAFGQNEKNWLKGITVESISGGSGFKPKKSGGFLDKFKL